jgi:hypothetical protein
MALPLQEVVVDADMAAVAPPPPSDGHAVEQISPTGAGSSLREDALTLTALLQQFRRRLEDPLLSLPDPKIVHRRLFHASPSTARRSKRLAAKGKGVSVSAVKRAQRILMSKLGIYRDNEKLSATQLEEYASIFASPLGPEQMSAITALFGLSCPENGESLVEATGV